MGDLNYRRYWELRYRLGATSGAGSYGANAEYKASVVNDCVHRFGVRTVLEFGCGDGNQLGYMDYASYVGLDVSKAAVKKCSKKFADDSSKCFRLYDPRQPLDMGQYDMTVSLEVLMHITDEDDFVATLDHIFAHSRNLVVIQTSLYPIVAYKPGSHERHRELLPYLEKYEFTLAEKIIHPSTTEEGRQRGEIGEMIADFVVLTRNAG